jgi:choline-glycine betaine transporter
MHQNDNKNGLLSKSCCPFAFAYISGLFQNYMNIQSILGVIFGITLVATFGTTTLLQQVYAANWVDPNPDPRKAPPAISGENVYVAWWTNNTAQQQ